MTRVSVTARYSRIHNALAVCAQTHGVTPFAARVLLAVADRDGSATNYDLMDDLAGPHGPRGAESVRRAVLELTQAGLVVARGADGGPVRAGTRTLVSLTENGRLVADAVRLRAEGKS